MGVKITTDISETKLNYIENATVKSCMIKFDTKCEGHNTKILLFVVGFFLGGGLSLKTLSKVVKKVAQTCDGVSILVSDPSIIKF